MVEHHYSRLLGKKKTQMQHHSDKSLRNMAYIPSQQLTCPHWIEVDLRRQDQWLPAVDEPNNNPHVGRVHSSLDHGASIYNIKSNDVSKWSSWSLCTG